MPPRLIPRDARERKAELLKTIQENAEKRDEVKRRTLKAEPPKGSKDSPKANGIGFGALVIFAVIGAILMLAVVIRERPTAFVPLMIILGIAAAAVGIMIRYVFGKDDRVSSSTGWRYFTATGLIITGILAAGALLALPPMIWGQ